MTFFLESNTHRPPKNGFEEKTVFSFSVRESARLLLRKRPKEDQAMVVVAEADESTLVREERAWLVCWIGKNEKSSWRV